MSKTSSRNLRRVAFRRVPETCPIVRGILDEAQHELCCQLNVPAWDVVTVDTVLSRAFCQLRDRVTEMWRSEQLHLLAAVQRHVLRRRRARRSILRRSAVVQTMPPTPLSCILDERARQKARGYTSEHDQQHTDGSLLRAATGLLEAVLGQSPPAVCDRPDWVPGFVEHATTKYRDNENQQLVIAAALLLAELERRHLATATAPQVEQLAQPAVEYFWPTEPGWYEFHRSSGETAMFELDAGASPPYYRKQGERPWHFAASLRGDGWLGAVQQPPT